MGTMRASLLLGVPLLVAVLAASVPSDAADLGSLKDGYAAPMPIPTDRGWYLKGFIGMTNQEVDDIHSKQFDTSDFTVLQAGFDSSPLFGLGIGYQHNAWLRFDLTGEYRGGATFHGLDSYTGANVPPPGHSFGTNEYTATKSEWLGLANAYVDIFTWRGITPYVGAGIGVASVSIDDFKDVNVPNDGVAFANSHSETNFAWAVHAGLSYEVTPSMVVDLAYRYVDLGDGKSGTISAYDGSNTFPPLEFKDITSHDVMLGVRWKLNHEPASFVPMK
jgi:opacity protein-like surface antigen